MTGKDESNRNVVDYAEATVEITNVPSSIDVTKTPDPAVVNEPGGTVTYTVHVTNTSSVDSVTLTAAGFEDKVKKNGAADTGDINAIGDLSCEGGFPVHLAPGAGVNCTFSLPVSGVPTDKINDRITVTGTDDDGQAGQ